MGRPLKSAGASSRASRIFTSSVSLTGKLSPKNLVVDMDFCLKIIDFDATMKVNDEDEVVDGQCGMKGWMLSEMEKLMYNPIKAGPGRWSAGQVLLYLLNLFRKEYTVHEDDCEEAGCT